MEPEIDTKLPDEETNNKTTTKDETERQNNNKNKEVLINKPNEREDEERNDIGNSNDRVDDCDDDEKEPVKETLDCVTPRTNGAAGNSEDVNATTTPDLHNQPHTESLDTLKEKLNKFLRWCEVNLLTLSEKVCY